MMKKQNKIYLVIGIVALVLIVAIALFSIPKGEETIKLNVSKANAHHQWNYTLVACFACGLGALA